MAGTQLNLNEAPLKSVPGGGDAIAGRDALAAAGISPGVMKPFDVLVENGADPAAIAAKLRDVPGVVGAAAPAAWRSGDASIVEAFPAVDGSSDGIQHTIDAVRQSLEGTQGTLGGIAAADRDFVHAIYDNFPYVLAFVILLTLVLLARAFRSIVLAVKAVVLNVISLAAAFGVIVLVFQYGFGSELWNIDATQSINPWIPLLIFAFLFGLSMDYEVFMLSSMREAYDETGSTERAIELGLVAHRQARHQRSADPDVRVPRALHRPRRREQGAGDRARGRDHRRRDHHPSAADARTDAPDGRRELVDAALDALRAADPRARRLGFTRPASFERRRPGRVGEG